MSGSLSNHKKIFITGVSGHIGSQLALALLEKGHEVIGLTRDPAKIASQLKINKRFRLMKGDLHDAFQLKKSLRNVDIIFHLAASLRMFEKENELYETNVLGLKNLLLACGCPDKEKIFVFASTMDVINSMSDYANTKTKGEELVVNKGKACRCFLGKIVRIGNVYDDYNGVSSGILSTARRMGWKSSLLFYNLGKKHIYPIRIDSAVRKIADFGLSNHGDAIISLFAKRTSVEKIIMENYPDFKNKAKPVVFGNLLLKLWSLLGRFLKRGDLLVYLNYIKD